MSNVRVLPLFVALLVLGGTVMGNLQDVEGTEPEFWTNHAVIVAMVTRVYGDKARENEADLVLSVAVATDFPIPMCLSIS